MNRSRLLCLLFFVFVFASAFGQTTVTSSGTTATVGNVPYISAASSTSTTLASSPISVSGSNVGVGTSTPGLNLEADGAIGLPATSRTAQTGIFRIRNISGNGSLDTGLINGGGAWLQVTNAGNLSAGYPLLLNPNGGLVGINTTTPNSSYALDVAGAIHTSSGYAFADGTYQSTAYTSGAAAVNALLALSGGNIGIGTTSPNAQLTIQSQPLGTTAGNTASILSLQDGDANHSYLNFFQLRNSNGDDWTTATTRIQQIIDATSMGYMDFNPPNGTFGLAFGSGSTEYIRIANGGNVGIGTTAPGKHLDVSGTILQPTRPPAMRAASSSLTERRRPQPSYPPTAERTMRNRLA